MNMPDELRHAIERYFKSLCGSKRKAGCGKQTLREAFFELDAIYERTLPKSTGI